MTLTELDKGAAEAERLRPERAANYAAKAAAGFRCQSVDGHGGRCEVTENLFVIQTPDGRKVACSKHVGRNTVCPGQRPRRAK